MSENSALLSMLGIAAENHLRPLFILCDKERGGWSSIDTSLLIARTMLEADRCEHCGNFIWVCRERSPFSDRFVFEVTDDVCRVDRVMQDASDSDSDEVESRSNIRKDGKTRSEEKSRRSAQRYKYGIINTPRAILIEGEKEPTYGEYHEYLKSHNAERKPFEVSPNYWTQKNIIDKHLGIR